MTRAPELGSAEKNLGLLNLAFINSLLISLFINSESLALIRAIALPPNPPPIILEPSAPNLSAVSTAKFNSGHETV